MKFLVDAQLPRRLARLLQAHGHDALHTLDLPTGNTTTDTAINAISVQEQRIVVTKDADFVTSFTLQSVPYKLLLVATGNSTNDDLLALITHNLPVLETTLTTHQYVELTRTAIIIHV